MDLLTVTLLFAVIAYLLKTGEQRQRITLLSQHLGPFKIEPMMERLHDGYLKTLNEPDIERQNEQWASFGATERQLAQQFERFAASFAKAEATATWINRNPLPHARRWLPTWLAPGLDGRVLMQLHNDAIARTVRNDDRQVPRDRARRLLAELYLMQHSCHWFCRSHALASARLLTRHQTAYPQVLQAVSPATQQAYLALTGIRPPPSHKEQ